MSYLKTKQLWIDKQNPEIKHALIVLDQDNNYPAELDELYMEDESLLHDLTKIDQDLQHGRKLPIGAALSFLSVLKPSDTFYLFNRIAKAGHHSSEDINNAYDDIDPKERDRLKHRFSLILKFKNLSDLMAPVRTQNIQDNMSMSND